LKSIPIIYGISFHSKHKNTDLKRVHKDFKSLVDGLDQTFDGQVILAEDAFNFEELTLSFTLRPNEGATLVCLLGVFVSCRSFTKCLVLSK